MDRADKPGGVDVGGGDDGFYPVNVIVGENTYLTQQRSDGHSSLIVLTSADAEQLARIILASREPRP